MVTVLGVVAPIGAFPVGVSFIVVGSKTLRIFRGAVLRRKSSPSLTNCDLNKGVGQKGEFLSS